MKKAAITVMVAASTLLAVGQIDGALLNELDAVAQMQEEGARGMTPENAYNEATGGMGIGVQIEEATQQIQQSTTQESVEHYDVPQEVPQETVPQDTQQQNPTVG